MERGGRLMNNNRKEFISNGKAPTIGIKQYQIIADLVDDLGWDYQSMTTSGRETYKKLCLKLGWEFEWDEELG